MKEKTISVIVPMYNTRALIGRCLESLTAQSHEALEIIVVDDGSTDGSEKEAERYAARDGRISIIRHERNRGLFAARMSGVGAAGGEYVGFVDSDDYVSKDFFRSLLSRAVECDSDVTVARLVHEDSDGRRYVHNRYHFYDPGALEGEEARRKFWEQEGYCFIWHTVWNKLYKRELWQRAMPYLSRVDRHLIMCEDFLFSSLLFTFARRVAFTEYGRYYYYQHSAASTGAGGGYEKYRKNVSDLIFAFDRAEELLREASDFRYGEELAAWRRLYKHFWRENVTRSGLSPIAKRRLLSELEQLSEGDPKLPTPSYFYTSVTPYDGRYEDILAAILSPETEAVSFDVFDTLMLRPFYTPSDLFYMLNPRYAELRPEDPRLFSDIRINAEKLLRERLGEGDEPYSDVTLRQIYDLIAEDVGEAAADRLMGEEIGLELKYCRPRRSALNLWQAARACGKRIFFTSDMYLPSEVIRAMLKSCGYTDCELLLSCEERATKRDGRLYRLLIKKSGIRPERIIHIGDNWESDYLSAKRRGINAVFYPSAVACLEYDVSDVKTTHTGVCFTEASRTSINYKRGFDFLGTRTAFALAAAGLYDNPFESYNEYSEMNASPRFLGYYALGMHLLGFTKWLAESAADRGYSSLAFVARDGYLPMKAYELMAECFEGAPPPRYIYTSRKAALSCEISSPEDIDALPTRMNVKNLTPRRLYEMLCPILEGAAEPSGLSSGLPFGTEERFRRFVAERIKPHFSKHRADAYRIDAADYLRAALPEGCAMVDIGYSGRTQELVYRLTGVRADAYYLHVNDDRALGRAESCGFKIHTFYDFTPSVTGAVRELFFSKPAPSAVGYLRCEDGTVEPVFENATLSFPERYLIEELQRNALLLVSEFVSVFGDGMSSMKMRSMDVSMPLEYFIHTLTDEDARMFDCVVFEDELWAGGSFSLPDAWRADIAYHGTLPHYMLGRSSGEPERASLEEYYRLGADKKGPLSRALYWLKRDRGVFLKKLKGRLWGGGV